MCLHLRKQTKTKNNNNNKYRSMVITTGQKHQRSLRLKLEIDSETIKQVKEHRVLGFVIDDELLVGDVCKTVSKNVFLMLQLKRYVNSQTLQILFNSHITPI